MNRYQRRASAAVQRRDARRAGEARFTFELRCPKCVQEETIRTNTALTARDGFRCATCGHICPAVEALHAAQIHREMSVKQVAPAVPTAPKGHDFSGIDRSIEAPEKI